MTAMEALRRNVVSRRAKQRISQADLAEEAGVARQTLSKIESGAGNVTLDVLERISGVLCCGVAELFEARSTAASDEELERRAKAPRSEFIEATALLRAIDEANEVRYSRAGRPKTMGRRVSS